MTISLPSLDLDLSSPWTLVPLCVLAALLYACAAGTYMGLVRRCLGPLPRNARGEATPEIVLGRVLPAILWPVALVVWVVVLAAIIPYSMAKGRK